MTNVVVFEGLNEVLVVSAAKVNAFIQLWFLEGKRNLDEYDVYLTDVDEGFAVMQRMSFEDGTCHNPDFDVTELMPADLREGLVAADLLTL